MSDPKPQYVQYMLWRLDSVFHNLESNERIVAKQHFLGTWESFQSKVLLASYSTTGLRADCDVLCVRVADSLEVLQDMTSRVASSGMGKFMMPAYSFLTLATGPRFVAKAGEGEFAPGQGRYLFAAPWARGSEWYALGASARAKAETALAELAVEHQVRLHPGLRSLEEVDELVAVEADEPARYVAFASALKEARRETHSPAGPVFAGTLKDIRDQVDWLD